MTFSALRSSRTTRFALWLMFAALLMKAAVPMLATASARAQGKALIEVCSVYGVHTIVVDAAHSPLQGSSSGGDESHARDHCALTGVVAWAMNPSPPVLAVVHVPPADSFALPALPAGWPDPHAMWVARLKHGPPVFA